MARSGSRLKTVFGCILALIGWNCFAALQVFGQTKPKPSTLVIGKYVGPGSCSAAACHGGVTDSRDERGKQTEYGTWIIQDAHARAFHSLENQVSLRMGKILGLAKPPASEEKCLACHALSPKPAETERNIDIKMDGVSCESCHGPASGWLESHIRKNSTETSKQCGMYDIKNVELRTMKCLECHLGTEKKEVDHSMIAAGHPDLLFQLELYSVKQPPHWRRPDDPKDPIVQKDPSYGVRLWAVGQAVQLREALDRLARRAQPDRWPEFSEYNCFSCHHPLTKPETSWRQERDCNLADWINGKAKDTNCSFIKGGSWPETAGYDPIEKGRTAGLPQWNTGHYGTFLLLARQIDRGTTDLLTPQLTELYAQTNAFRSAKGIHETAASARKNADALVKAIHNAKFDDQQVANLLEKISASGDLISYDDTRSAEQAWMALDSLLRCYEKQGEMTVSQNGKHPGNLSALRDALDSLFKEFDNPSTFNGPRFASGMRKFNAVLHSSGIAAARASR
jgi:hypothetical protein